MADGTILNAGTGGDTIQTEQVGGAGVKYPVTKIYTGALDINGGPVTSTNPLDVRISDATNTASVKAASTAAVATDKALVVTEGPNRSEPASVVGSLGALNATVQVNCAGFAGCSTLVAAGTLVGTIVSEASMDGGASWQTVSVTDPFISGLAETSFSPPGSSTIYQFNTVPGASLYRLRVSAYTSGTVQATLRASDAIYSGGAALSAFDQGSTFTNFVQSASAALGAGKTGLVVRPYTSSDGTNVTPTMDTAARKAFVAVTDGTNVGAVKAASTAALAADAAIVVAISPNNSVAVTGTFFQATQPVSAASLPLPTGAAQDATLTGGTAKVINRGGAKGTTVAADVTSVSVDANTQALHTNVTNFPATQAVSGTFWQSTQPVSLAASVAVTGTFWQATQPVSLAAAVDTSDRAARLLGVVYGSQAAQLKQTATNFNAQCELAVGATLIDPRSIRALTATDVVTVTPPTLTKGTQAATGFSVQDLKDSGRVYCNFSASAVACVATEALVTLTPYRDLVAGSTGTTFAVTSGKRLRLQTLILTVRTTSTVSVGGLIRLRLLAGTVLVSSPVHASIGSMSSNLATAVIGNALTYHIDLPDGLELSGTMQLGLTQLFSATTATIDVQIIGFEY